MSMTITTVKEFKINNTSILTIKDAADTVLTTLTYTANQITFAARPTAIITTPFGLRGLLDHTVSWGEEVIRAYNPVYGTYPYYDYKIQCKPNGNCTLKGDVDSLEMDVVYDRDDGDAYTGPCILAARPEATVSISGFMVFCIAFRAYVKACYKETNKSGLMA